MSALDSSATDHEPIAGIKARANIVDIIGRYADLTKRGNALWAKCPLHADSTPSFKVNPGLQTFYCFGCRAKGDVFDFLAVAERLDLPIAIERVLELVGGAKPDPATAAARTARRVQADAEEARKAARNTALARRILAESDPLTRRSDPLAVAYLVERRGIAQWQPQALRWHAQCPWRTGTAGCLVVPVEDRAGEVTGVWRIKPAMEGEVERRGLGPVKGCCAPVVDDAGLDMIVVAEGIEDALSAWVLTTYPAWAALSAGNMAALELPARFEQVIVCADAEPQGREAAKALARRLRAEGREARVIEPIVDKDANDVLRARRAA